MKKVTITVTGKVQGVFFRMYTKNLANKLGLIGWVENEKDGSVYIVAAGEEESIDRLIEWCHEGPPLAKVLEVKVKDKIGPVEGTDFEVRK